MKKLLILVLLSASGLFASLEASQTKSEYYRHLMFRETPYAPYRGIYPIDKSTAQHTAHYKFDFDNKGRVVQISHQIGDELIADNGNWDTFIWFAPRVNIEYADNSETHKYFDADNQRIQTHGKVYTAKYTLNNGERTSLTFYDNESKPSENEWNAHQYVWRKNDKGHVIEKRFNLNKEQVSIRPQFKFFETHFQYDADGKLEFVYNYGTEGKPTNNDSGAGIDRIFYDLAGNFQRWHVYDKDGNPVDGNRPGVHIGEHLYDNLGNKVGLRGFDKFGAPKGFAWGNFSMSHTYDDFGNQTSSSSYDVNGNMLFNAKVEYSNDGVYRRWIKFVDTQGELVNAPQLGGAAALRFNYEDGKKLPASRTRFDKDLKEVKS